MKPVKMETLSRRFKIVVTSFVINSIISYVNTYGNLKVNINSVMENYFYYAMLKQQIILPEDGFYATVLYEKKCLSITSLVDF